MKDSIASIKFVSPPNLGAHEVSLLEIAGITATLHDHIWSSFGESSHPVAYDAEFAFNDLTNSRASVGLYKL